MIVPTDVAPRRTGSTTTPGVSASSPSATGVGSVGASGQTPTASKRSSEPIQRAAGPPSASPTARAAWVARSSALGSERESQLRAEYAATCFPCTIAQPAVSGTSATVSRPGRGVPHPTRPTSSTTTATAAAPSTSASCRRTCPVLVRHRCTMAATHKSWKTTYAGWATADHRA